MKQLWILVGGNGAGRSTFYRLMLKPLGIPFINADEIAREIYPEGNSYNAAKIVQQMHMEQVQAGIVFVFSHPSKIDFLAHAKALGYQVILPLIHLEHSNINKARISQRVAEGGHHVPDEKVEIRIPRTLSHVKKAVPLCDQVRVLDNSHSEPPFIPVLSIIDGQTTCHLDPLPKWAENLLE